MEYIEYKPDTRLSDYVECYWSAWSECPPFREEETLIPDGTIELMFNFGDSYSKIIDGEKQPVKGSNITGIRKKALKISQTKKQDFFCIRFRPGGTYPFFTMPVHLFAGGFFGLEEIIGKEYQHLEEQLAGCASNTERVTITEKYLFRKIRGPRPDHGFVLSCLHMRSRKESPSIGGLAREMNTTYKTIERKFHKVVGLRPSHFLKIRRFNKALHTIYTGKHATLTEAALESGYYDQPHFIREFKQLTGYNPVRLSKSGLRL